MSKTMSIFLDALRFLAAVVVVVGHLSQPLFSNVWPNLTLYAIGSVAIFFVLSGFVISYVVTRREGNAFDYAVARISRLYSVLVPAVVLSTLVLFLGIWLRPEYMLTWVMQPDNHMLLKPHHVGIIAFRTLLPLTFLNIFHDYMSNMFPPLDSPIWSLGYEGAYYTIFGIAVFARGAWRWVLLVAMCFAAGPLMLSLFPMWLAGVGLQRLTHRWKPRSAVATVLGVVCLAAVAALWFEWPAYAAWASPHHGRWLTAVLQGSGHTSDAYASYYFGVATILAILGVASLDGAVGRVLIPMERPIRWFANHTFSLYLFHFPVIVMIAILTRYNPSSKAQVLAVFFAAVAICMLLSTVSEDRKLWWRKAVAVGLGRILSVVGPSPAGHTAVGRQQVADHRSGS